MKDRLAALEQSRAELTDQIGKAQKEIEGWPVETITAYGRTFKARNVTNEQVLRAYHDQVGELGRIVCEIRAFEPKTGRPKGRKNKHPKPLDPTIAAALEHRKTKEGGKLSFIKLAHKFARTKTFQDKKRWVYRLKKAIGSSFRPQ